VKVKVPLAANLNRVAILDTEATRGSTIGLDLHLPDGSTPTLAQLAAALAITSGAQTLTLPFTIWSRVREIPANVVSVAALTTSGLVTRKVDGSWVTRSITVESRLAVTNADGDAGNPLLDIADSAALSVLGRATNTSGDVADIQAGTPDQILRLNTAGTVVGFGSINLASADAVGTTRLAFANLAQITGQAVLGVSTAGAGNLAAISAGTNDRVFRQTADALNFGQLTAGMFPNLVVPDAALSANVALLARDPQNFTGANTWSTTRLSIPTSGPNTSDVEFSWITPADRVINLDSSNAGGPYIRFRRSGTTLGFLGNALGISGGTQDDIELDALTGALVLSTAAVPRITITSAGAISLAGALQLLSYGAGTLTTDASGNVTAVSDERAKRNVRPYTRGTADLLQLNPIQYGYTRESGLDQTKDDYASFSAQDVERIFPEAVGRMYTQEPDERDEDGNITKPGRRFTNETHMRTMDTRPIMAAIVNSIKELDARISQLE
jgi:hypothetical protein